MTGSEKWRRRIRNIFAGRSGSFSRSTIRGTTLSQNRGRPISELPIPEEISAAGLSAVRRYQDEHRLAYQSEAPVNWCPALGTVLANEEVVDGKSERGGHPVERRPLRQWMLRITAYAERLEEDLDGLDWPEGIKLLQRNWIGRSTGAEVDFFLGHGDAFAAWSAARNQQGYPRKPADDVLRIYTTRPDTLFGATYMVIAPEHPLSGAADDRGPTRSGGGLYRLGGIQKRLGADRTVERQDRRLHRLACHQPGEWPAHTDLGRGLCPDQLRYGSHYGGAGA